MAGGDLNWFVSLVMPCMPLVAVALTAHDAWTRRRRQIVSVPIEREKKAWIS
jgi:hypothetical protein